MKTPSANSRKTRKSRKPQSATPGPRKDRVRRVVDLAVDCVVALRHEADVLEDALDALQSKYDAILAALDIADGRASKGGRP